MGTSTLSHTHMRFARRLNQLCGQTFDNLDESCNAPTLGIRLTPPPTPPAAGGLLLWLVPCHGVDEHIEGGGGVNPLCHLTMCTVSAHAHDRRLPIAVLPVRTSFHDTDGGVDMHTYWINLLKLQCHSTQLHTRLHSQSQKAKHRHTEIDGKKGRDL